jgi:hypothetical protein
MVLVALVLFSDLLSRKNICDACSVKKYGCVVQVPLIDDLCYFW